MALYDPAPKIDAAPSLDFTVADVLAWARTKHPNARYQYDDPANCALCRFLRDTMRAVSPQVAPHLSCAPGYWRDRGGVSHPYRPDLEPALSDSLGDDDWTFGALVKRLEELL